MNAKVGSGLERDRLYLPPGAGWSGDGRLRVGAAARRLDDPELLEQQALERREWRVHQQYLSQRVIAGEYMRPVVTFEREYRTDGGSYVTDARVEFDTAPVAEDPVSTLEKAERIHRAALANGMAEPEELVLAARAAMMAALARARMLNDSPVDPAAGSEPDRTRGLEHYRGVAALGDPAAPQPAVATRA